jgi:hypothetical protein
VTTAEAAAWTVTALERAAEATLRVWALQDLHRPGAFSGTKADR